MRCECGGKTVTVDSRSYDGNRTRRRRECVECKNRFSTIEIPMPETTVRVKPKPGVGLNREKVVRNSDARRKLENLRDQRELETDW